MLGNRILIVGWPHYYYNECLEVACPHCHVEAGIQCKDTPITTATWYSRTGENRSTSKTFHYTRTLKYLENSNG